MTQVVDTGCGLLAVGDEGGRLSVLSADTGELVHQIDTLCGAVNAVAALCGGRAATGHSGGAIRLWSLCSGEPACEGRHSHPGESICALAFVALPSAAPPTASAAAAAGGPSTQKGPRWLLASSDDGMNHSGRPNPVRLWDVEAGAVAPGLSLAGHEGPLRAMCDLGSGRLLATDLRSLRVWCVKSRVPLFVARDVSAEPFTAARSLAAGAEPAGGAVWDLTGVSAAACMDAAGAVTLWEWREGEKALRCQRGEPLAPVLLAHDASGARASDSGRDKAAPGGIAASADGQLVAAADSDGVCRVWDSSGRRELCRIRPHAADAFSGALALVNPAAAGCIGVAAGADGYIRAFRLSDGQLERSIRCDSTASPSGRVAFSAIVHLSGAFVAAAGDDGRLHLANIESGARSATNAGSRLTTALVVLRDGTLVSGHGDGALRLWALADAPPKLQQAAGRPYLEAPNGGHRDAPVDALACVPVLGRAGGPLLERLVSLCDCTVWVWDAVSRRHVSTLRIPVDVVSVASAGVGRLACLGANDTLLLWGLQEKSLLCDPVPAASSASPEQHGRQAGGWVEHLCALPAEPSGRVAVAERTADGAAVFRLWAWDSVAEALAPLPLPPGAEAALAPEAAHAANGSGSAGTRRAQFVLGSEPLTQMAMAVSALHPQLLLTAATSGQGSDAPAAFLVLRDTWRGGGEIRMVAARGLEAGVACLAIIPQQRWR